MKIAILGWSRLSQGASLGGGYNLIAQQHALSLVKQGNNVCYLRSGQDFSLAGAIGQSAGQSIRCEKTWKNIFCYSLVNSHNWAPADRNGINRSYQIQDEGQDNLVIKWTEEQEIDSVFIHSLEGQSFSLIEKLKAAGIQVSVFCHDYYFVCPRVSFLFCGQIPCLNNDGGKRCASCMAEDMRFPLKRYIKSHIPISRKTYGLGTIQETLEYPELVSNGALVECISCEWERSAWGERNRKAIEALNWADRVFSPSRFLGEVLKAGGLKEFRLRIVKIGLNHLDVLKEQSIQTGPDDGRMHFAFHGGNQFHKGVSLLIKSIELISDEIRVQSCFHLWGVELPEEIQGVRTYPAYHTDELSKHAFSYHIGILSHLWFENSPVAMLEHLAMGKPVITPRLGGVEDYIEEGKNGWFFEPGDPESLASVLEKIVKMKDLPILDRDVVNSKTSFFKSLLL